MQPLHASGQRRQRLRPAPLKSVQGHPSLPIFFALECKTSMRRISKVFRRGTNAKSDRQLLAVKSPTRKGQPRSKGEKGGEPFYPSKYIHLNQLHIQAIYVLLQLSGLSIRQGGRQNIPWLGICKTTMQAPSQAERENSASLFFELKKGEMALNPENAIARQGA
jgi:hypothetical protein